MADDHNDPGVINIDSPDGVVSFIHAAGTNTGQARLVRKIVIGPSPGSADAWDAASLVGLTDVDWHAFPKLTHLYLWSIRTLQHLGTLPSTLECLDLRGCTGLAALPESLPKSLRTLDLGGCTEIKSLPKTLPAGLEELFLDGCTGLLHFAPVEKLLGPPTTAGRGGRRPRRSLRRLELHGCRFDDLDESFCGEAGENVLPRIQEKLRQEAEQGPALLPECKVIVLGSGGAGKTSLVRALKGLPFRDEPYTERIRLWTWNGGVRFRPFDDHPDLEARINIWDFGGQELYHNTHRMFLETRAVFIVVWRQPPSDGSPARPELPDDNKHFDLNYWLDQILIPQPEARVVIVRTHADDDEKNPPDDWKTHVREEYREIDSFATSACDDKRDSLEPLHEHLQQEIREELRQSEKSRIPKGWLAVRDALRTWQPENPNDDSPPTPSQKPVLRWREFQDLVREHVGKPGRNGRRRRDASIEKTALEVVRYLHDIGAVFFPRPWQERTKGNDRLPVVVDQAWAMQGIYHLETSPDVHEHQRESTGHLTRAALDALWARGGGGADANAPRFEPEHIWVFEQVMQAAGIMIDITADTDGERRFLFPDFLPDRADVEGLVQWPKSQHRAVYVVSDGRKTHFGKDFACRLVGRLRQESQRGSVRSFRFGGFVPLVSEETSVSGVPASVTRIEWVTPAAHAAVGSLRLTIRGDAETHHGAIRHALRLLEGTPGLHLRKPKVIEVQPPGSLAGLNPPARADEVAAKGKPVEYEQRQDADEPKQEAPKQRIVIAISYAGDPSEEANTDGNREVGIEFIPDRVYALLHQKLSPEDFHLILYKERQGISTLPQLITQLTDSAIVVAVVTMKYVNSPYCLEEYTRSALNLSGNKRFEEVFQGPRYPYDNNLITCRIDDAVLTFDVSDWLRNWTTETHTAFNDVKSDFGDLKGRHFHESKLRDRRTDAEWLIRINDYGDEIEKVITAIRNIRFEPWLRHENSPEDKRASLLAEHLETKAKEIQASRGRPLDEAAVQVRLRRIIENWNEGRYDEAVDAYEQLTQPRDVLRKVYQIKQTLGKDKVVIERIEERM